MKARARSPFSPGALLALLLGGALAFVATLYFAGTGRTGVNLADGGAHAGSPALHGYAALVRILEAEGREVRVSRSPAALGKHALLVLAPRHDLDPDDLRQMLDRRRHAGPTLVILPKWTATPLSPRPGMETRRGWVQLGSAVPPRWMEAFAARRDRGAPGALRAGATRPEGDMGAGGSTRWAGLGGAGTLPPARQYHFVEGRGIVPLVTGPEGKVLAGRWQPPSRYGEEPFGVTIIAEPDLVNNWGLADRGRAMLALRLVDEALDGRRLPIVFDLSASGLGEARSLLTLAFSPPFVAATIFLLFALALVGWRSWHRFGPALAESRAIAFGKGQLVANSAALVERARRYHLLAEPYLRLAGGRIARTLGLARPDPEAIDALLARRLPGETPYSHLAERVRAAKGPHELLRAAQALHTLERKLERGDR